MPPEIHGLDHVVVINKVISVGLVQRALDAAAQLRQHHHIEIIVLQNDGTVGNILPGFTDFFTDRHGIHLAGGSLIGTLLDEKRILFKGAGLIGWNGNLFLPDDGFAHDDPLLPDIKIPQSLNYNLISI